MGMTALCSSAKGAIRIRPSGLVSFFLCVFNIIVATSAYATTDLTLSGPNRFDRLQGKPTIYTQTFTRCLPSTEAVIKITNGSGKETRLKSASVLVNGTEIASENEFKQQISSFEKSVSVSDLNELTVVLKSGMQDDPNSSNIKDQSFLIIEVIGKGCDDTPPVIFEPAPADGALLNTSRPFVSAGYADEGAGSGIDSTSVRLAVDGVDVTSSAAISNTGVGYPAPVPFAEGAHTATVTVADKAHNSASLTWRFTIDTVAPVTTITPTGGLYNTAQSVTLATNETGTIYYTANGTQPTTGALVYSGPIQTTTTATLKYFAVDAAGNSEAVKSTTFTIDTQPPVLTVSTLSDGSSTENPTLDITGTVTDNLEVRSVTVNGEDVTVNNDGSFSRVLALTEGANVITIVVTDIAGNITTDARTITFEISTIDVTPPVTSLITNPAASDGENGWFKTAPLLTLISNETGTTYYKYGSTSDKYNYSRLPHEWVGEGTALNIRGDDTGAWYTLPFDFPFYGTPYSKVYLSSNGLIRLGTTDTSYGNSSSALAGKAAIAPLWDDLRTDVSSGNDIYVMVFQPDEDSVGFRWQAITYSGRCASNFEAILNRDGRIRFNYGSQAGCLTPTIGISKGDGVHYHVAYNNNIANTNNMESILYAPAGWEVFSNPVAGSEGEAPLYYYSVDINGNIEEVKSSPIKVDTLAPTGSISISSGAAYTNNPTVSLNLTCTDSTSGCSRMSFSNDNLTWSDPTSNATTATWTLSAGDGTKKVYARFKDAAGNTSPSSSDTIVLDSTPPTVTITEPAGEIVGTTKPRLVYSVSDGTVIVKVDNNIVSISSGSYLGPLTIGSHSIRVEATDIAGNVGFAERTFKVMLLALEGINSNTNVIDTSRNENVNIYYSVVDPAGSTTVTLKIYPEKQGPVGSPIYQASQAASSAGPYVITWNGMDNSGKVVPDEAYVYTLTADDGLNSYTYSPSEAAGTGNVNCIQDTYDPYKSDPLEINYSMSKAGRTDVVVGWRGLSYKLLSAVPHAAGSYSFEWDGRGTDGAIWANGAIATCTLTSLLRENTVISTGNTPRIEHVVVDPYEIQLSYGEFSRIRYALSREAVVTVKLISKAGQIITVLNNQMQSVGDHEVIWNGIDSTDSSGKHVLTSEEGDYIVLIQAVNPVTAANSSSRGNLRVWP